MHEVRLWTQSWLEYLKFLWQLSHSNGLYPVCLFICSLRFCFELSHFCQRGHSKRDYSPCTVATWRSRCFWLVYTLRHSGSGHSRRFFILITIMTEELNDKMAFQFCNWNQIWELSKDLSEAIKTRIITIIIIGKLMENYKHILQIFPAYECYMYNRPQFSYFNFLALAIFKIYILSCQNCSNKGQYDINYSSINTYMYDWEVTYYLLPFSFNSANFASLLLRIEKVVLDITMMKLHMSKIERKFAGAVSNLDLNLKAWVNSKYKAHSMSIIIIKI